jgi:hypothetical protein
VDEEIKNYISIHKHDLMSGMQDVAALSEKYQELQNTSHKLRTAVDKMQRDVSKPFPSHFVSFCATLTLTL